MNYDDCKEVPAKISDVGISSCLSEEKTECAFFAVASCTFAGRFPDCSIRNIVYLKKDTRNELH